ncbi:hypothetical protein NFI96_015679, partial [Prochilodus magdalenae]
MSLSPSWNPEWFYPPLGGRSIVRFSRFTQQNLSWRRNPPHRLYIPPTFCIRLITWAYTSLTADRPGGLNSPTSLREMLVGCVKVSLTLEYHRQSNGQCKQVNQEL